MQSGMGHPPASPTRPWTRHVTAAHALSGPLFSLPRLHGVSSPCHAGGTPLHTQPCPAWRVGALPGQRDPLQGSLFPQCKETRGLVTIHGPCPAWPRLRGNLQGAGAKGRLQLSPQGWAGLEAASWPEGAPGRGCNRAGAGLNPLTPLPQQLQLLGRQTGPLPERPLSPWAQLHLRARRLEGSPVPT